MRVNGPVRSDGNLTGRRLAAAAVVVLACLLPCAAQEDPFPRIQPTTRAQAEAAITGGVELPLPCMSSLLHAMELDPLAGSPGAYRAVRLLRSGALLPDDARSLEVAGVRFLFTEDPAVFDRIDSRDRNSNRLPDVLDEARGGLLVARRLMIDQLELAAPESLTVLLTRMDGNLSGYHVPGRNGPTTGGPLLVIDAGPGTGSGEVARAVVHQYAHAVIEANVPEIPTAWAEAFATWAVLATSGPYDATTHGVLEARLDSLANGLATDDMRLAAGNALWFSYLAESHGLIAVRLALHELGSGTAAADALDRAVRRSGGNSLEDAFRDFHLWTILTGERSTGMHFPFADALSSPGFVSIRETLPVISVQADPSIHPLGAAQVLLRPGKRDGGLTVRFEGEFPTRWEVDLLLFRADRSLFRVPVQLEPEGRGEVTIPLQGLNEAVLMVRNLDRADQGRSRYTWTAHVENGFPFEMAGLELQRASAPAGAVLVTWETESEHGLVGYNILRSRFPGSRGRKVNPIWVPALGDRSTPASYQFLDPTAEPGTTYQYRIEGITREGLRSLSDPVSVTLPGLDDSAGL